MEEYTREQIQRADDTDLYVFLSGRGEQFKRCGKEYRWLRHESVMINKNEWYRFSQNKGGHAIIQRADDTDLYVFLSGRGEQFKRCGKEYRWLRHESVMINKNEWYRFSQNKGGHAIDFMKEFYGLSFAEAVKELLGEEGAGDTDRRTAKEDAGRQKV